MTTSVKLRTERANRNDRKSIKLTSAELCQFISNVSQRPLLTSTSADSGYTGTGNDNSRLGWVRAKVGGKVPGVGGKLIERMAFHRSGTTQVYEDRPRPISPLQAASLHAGISHARISPAINSTPEWPDSEAQIA